MATLNKNEWTTVASDSFDNGTGLFSRSWGPGVDTSVPGQITMHSTGDNQDSGAMVPPTGANAGFGFGLYSFTLSISGDGSAASEAPGPYALLWPATDVWPGPELDVIERLEDGTPYSTMHFKDASGGNGYDTYMLNGVNENESHTYSLDWQADRLTMYVDGQEAWTTTDHVPQDFAHGGENSAPGIGMQTWWSEGDQTGDNNITLTDFSFQTLNAGQDGVGGEGGGVPVVEAPAVETPVVEAPAVDTPAPVITIPPAEPVSEVPVQTPATGNEPPVQSEAPGGDTPAPEAEAPAAPSTDDSRPGNGHGGQHGNGHGNGHGHCETDGNDQPAEQVGEVPGDVVITPLPTNETTDGQPGDPAPEVVVVEAPTTDNSADPGEVVVIAPEAPSTLLGELHGTGQSDVFTMNNVFRFNVDGHDGADTINLGENHSDVGITMRSGEAGGDVVTGFGAAGDHLFLTGYGEGAAIDSLGDGHFQVSGGVYGHSDIFTLTGVESLTVDQYSFV